MKTPKNVGNVGIDDFYREIYIVLGFDHDNIIKSHGYYLQGQNEIPHLILEFMHYGELRNVLRRSNI